MVVDGAGMQVEGPVVEVRRDSVVVAVDVRSHQPAPQPRLVVVQALAKGDRGERAVGAMTEVGVDVIVPWSAARSVTTWQGDRGVKSLDRWRSTAREAAKQARRSWFPDVAELESTDQVGGRIAAAALGVVCHESAAASLGAVDVPSHGDLVVVIGPEGASPMMSSPRSLLRGRRRTASVRPFFVPRPPAWSRLASCSRSRVGSADRDGLAVHEGLRAVLG